MVYLFAAIYIAPFAATHCVRARAAVCALSSASCISFTHSREAACRLQTRLGIVRLNGLNTSRKEQ